jgi:transglutaminase-like putative cysteine protease
LNPFFRSFIRASAKEVNALIRHAVTRVRAGGIPKVPRGTITQVDRRPPSLVLYIAGVAVQIAGLLPVSLQLGEPTFAGGTVGLTLVGAAVSYQLRLHHRHRSSGNADPKLIRWGVLFLCLAFLAFACVAYGIGGEGITRALLPPGAQETPLAAAALALAATFWSFLWLKDEAVVFACVWAIALIGLIGTVNVNRELILSFVAFLAAATFLLVHHGVLHQGTQRKGKGVRSSAGQLRLPSNAPQQQRQQRGQQQPYLLRTQVSLALLAWSVALVLGFLLAIPVQMIGRHLPLATVLQRLKAPFSPTRRTGLTPGRPHLLFDNLRQVKVGIGPVDDDPTERLWVLSEKPHHWRGRAFDLYTGDGWDSSLADTGQDRYALEGQDTPEGLSSFDLAPVGEIRKGVVRVTHRFKLGAGVFGPLYACAEPRRVRAPVLSLKQRADNTIGVGRGMGDEYEVDSEIVQPSDDLRRSGTQYPEKIVALYLRQGTGNEALRRLAAEATAGAPDNPFDRAERLRRFVADRCAYTRQAAAVPAGRDVAEYFLTESKEGHCDLYATALTVLCRYAGLPARLVTGFGYGTLAGNRADLPRVGANDRRQWYVLRGSDMHAWTEVYFAHYGWIPFDATDGTRDARSGATVAPAETRKPPTPGAKSFWARLLAWIAPLKRNPSLLILLLVALGLGGFLVYRRIFFVITGWPGRYWGWLSRRAGGAARSEEIARLYSAALRRVARRGGRRPATMTASEYVAHVRAVIGPGVATELARLTALVERALYGPGAPGAVTEAEVRAARAACRAVLIALRTGALRTAAPLVSSRWERIQLTQRRSLP